MNATQAGVKFPDCIFIMNTWDEPRWASIAPRDVRCSQSQLRPQPCQYILQAGGGTGV